MADLAFVFVWPIEIEYFSIHVRLNLINDIRNLVREVSTFGFLFWPAGSLFS